MKLSGSIERLTIEGFLQHRSENELILGGRAHNGSDMRSACNL
jgi:hypothetical protein